METDNLPKHIAIIMDGNRRWAKKLGMPAKFGHSEGAKTLENIVSYCNKIGIKVLTVYAFSTENWKRSDEEVNALMDLLTKYIQDFEKNSSKENIKVRILGDITRLREDLQQGIVNVQNSTMNNTGLQFNIALNYGGREELLKATKEIATLVKNDELNVDDINEEIFAQHLYTHDQPDVDLMIRTSGEIRISNFLPWQLSYAEMLFVDKNWPDFKPEDIDMAVEEFQKRNRKFGGK